MSSSPEAQGLLNTLKLLTMVRRKAMNGDQENIHFR